MSSQATLSAAADDRKARLAKLKSLKRKQPSSSEAEDGAAPAPSQDHRDSANDQQERQRQPQQPQQQQQDDSTAPPTQDVARLHLSGRNYDFETKGPKLGFEASPTLGLAQPTLEEQAQDLEEQSRRRAALDAQQAADKGIDLFTLQPRKPNWDLKRELNLKMEVLNVRTENAIARLVREMLADKKKAAEAAAAAGGRKERQDDGEGDAEAEGMLDGAAIVEGMRLREREEQEEARREREAEAEEFGMA